MRNILGLTLCALGMISFSACGGDDTATPGQADSGTMSCVSDMDCDDGVICNGVESCVLNVCGPGDDATDGTSCTDPAEGICVDGYCANSVCGDGYVDRSRMETCDDSNTDPGDGCEPDCTLTCSSDADCDDANPCNGVEQCEGSGSSATCSSGMNMSDGTPCGTGRACRSGDCVSIGCGDGVVDPGEQCDDANSVDGDGCDTDCSWSCTSDDQCDDGDMCTGTETCDLSTHTCVDPPDLDCTPSDACHTGSCDPMMGCQEALIDGDMDGHAATSLGACGDDCNDGDDTIYDGAAELCDGEDNDCDMSVDEGNPVWYADCDSDGYAVFGAPSMISCSRPLAFPSSCRDVRRASWTTNAPTRSSSDCNDSRSDVNPAVTAYSSSPHTSSSYDWDCNGSAEKRYTTTNVDPEGFCLTDIFGGTCAGAAGWTGRTTPACGTSATYTSCRSIRGRCSRSSYSFTQSCR